MNKLRKKKNYFSFICLLIYSFERMSYFTFLPIIFLGKRKKEIEEEMDIEGNPTQSVVQAFERSYKDPNSSVEYLLECFDDYIKEWNASGTSKWYSPYTTLVQASDWGK